MTEAKAIAAGAIALMLVLLAIICVIGAWRDK